MGFANGELAILVSKHLRLGVFSCIACLVGANAFGFEDDRYNFFTGINYAYDGNIFRTPKSGVTWPKKDLIRQTYIGVGLNLPVSMQRFVVNARVNQTRYRDLDALDYNGRSVSATWFWQVGSDWSGRLGYSQSRTASDFSNVGGTTQNLRDQDRVFVDAFVMLDPTHRVEMGVSQAKSQNSAQTIQANDYTDRQLYFGIQYISAANNSYGLRISYDGLKLPNPTRIGSRSIDGSHKDYVLDFTYNWRLNGVSKIFGRLGYEGRAYNEFNGRDYTGLAWNFSYDWTPNDKSALLFNLRREIDGLNDFASSYAFVHGLSVQPRWLVSPKLNVNWELSYLLQEYRGDPGIVAGASGQERKDKVKSYGMSVGYAPAPSANLLFSVRRDQRSSNVSGIDFEDTVYSGGLDLKF